MEDETQEVQPVEQPTQESTAVIEAAHVAAKRIEEATAAQKLENDRTERLAVQNTLSGKSEAGIATPKAIPLTDAEYADKVEKGEVNPFAEDGFN